MPPDSTKRHRSLSFIVIATGGSNSAQLEIEAIFHPPYNAASLGMQRVYTPRQANVALVVGSLTAKSYVPVNQMLAQLPPDTKIILVGTDAISGAPYARNYAVFGPFQENTPSASKPASTTSENAPPELPPTGSWLPPGLKIARRLTGAPPDPRAIIAALLQLSTD